jgi:hypothetical protein
MPHVLIIKPSSPAIPAPQIGISATLLLLSASSDPNTTVARGMESRIATGLIAQAIIRLVEKTRP